MAAVSAPLPEVERILKTVDGYVVIANINSPVQSVIGGATPAVDAAIAAFTAAKYQAVKIPVSHAFHTEIVAPASQPLREVIARMNIRPPRLPIIANVTGEVYPTDPRGNPGHPGPAGGLAGADGAQHADPVRPAEPASLSRSAPNGC